MAEVHRVRAGHPRPVPLVGVVDLHRQGLINGMDQILSAQFITAGGYGTRSSTTLWSDRQGYVRWRESSFDESGELVGQRQESFCLSRGTSE